jgi:methylated-DNA-protein-cysteine methyltransferase-like protein
MGPPISVSKDQFAGELDTNQDISKAERIWQVVAQIPTGRVISYGDVAKRAGLPGYARYVGTTLGKLPRDTRLPWHRVVNASRKIAPRGSARMVEQKQRLDAEGVSFNGETVLKEFYW